MVTLFSGSANVHQSCTRRWPIAKPKCKAAAGHNNVAVTSAYLHIVEDDDELMGNLFEHE